MAEDIELEAAEDRRDLDALQAVRTPCQPAGLVRDLARHGGDAERDHQARQVAAAQHEEARREGEYRPGGRPGEQPADRLARDELGEQPGPVRAGAEERRLPERHDARIAEDQVDRQDEQPEARDLVEEEVLLRQQEHAGQCGEPEHDLQPARPARARHGAPDRIRADPTGGARHHRARANRPCGRRTRTAIISTYTMKPPSEGTKYLPSTSARPSSSAATSGPTMLDVPPTVTTIRK